MNRSSKLPGLFAIGVLAVGIGPQTAGAALRPLLAATAPAEPAASSAAPAAPVTAPVAEAQKAPAAETTDILLEFKATDGTPLEGKLTVPAGRSGPVPVVFNLHGAGPRTYDNPFRYRDADGHLRTGRYYDYHAGELARRGIAFFRTSKRGCHSAGESPMEVDRAVFSKATPSVLLDDYAKALEALRKRPEIDARRIVLFASSEGTRLAPELACRMPEGIVGLALTSYMADNTQNTLVWQNTVGPWRNIEYMLPAARDGELTKAEYDAAVAADATLAKVLPFQPIDADANGAVTPAELAAVTRPRLDALRKAVTDHDDELLWKGLLNLTSAYLLEWWDGEPSYTAALALNVPIAVFHGERDGTCRVEGVREMEKAFRDAKKTNLSIHIYPDANHDLNWTWKALTDGGPPAYRDAFSFAADLVSDKPTLPAKASARDRHKAPAKDAAR